MENNYRHEDLEFEDEEFFGGDDSLFPRNDPVIERLVEKRKREETLRYILVDHEVRYSYY